MPLLVSKEANHFPFFFFSTPQFKVHCRIFFIFSPCSFYSVTRSADPQKEHTLSPGTFPPEACSNQPRKQRSDVNPTASSARSQTGILLSVLRQDYLNTSKRIGAVLFLLNSTSTLETGRRLGRVSFRKGFWDRYWGRAHAGQLLAIFSRSQ